MHLITYTYFLFTKYVQNIMTEANKCANLIMPSIHTDDFHLLTFPYTHSPALQVNSAAFIYVGVHFITDSQN